MRKAGSTYELGRAAFGLGILKFSDDPRMMAVLAGMTGREAKRTEMAEWRRGWFDARTDAEAPVEEAPKKKKKAKKKASKKKAKK